MLELALAASADALYIEPLGDAPTLFVHHPLPEALGYMGDGAPASLSALLHADDALKLQAARARMATSDGVQQTDVRLRRADGSWTWRRLREIACDRTADGAIASVLGTARDISEERGISEAASLTEERLRAALRNTPVTLATMDRSLRYTWSYNPHPDFVGRIGPGATDRDLLPGDQADALTGLKRQVLETGKGTRVEESFRLPSGVVWYDVILEALAGRDGQPEGLFMTAIDVTERKQAEERQRLLMAEVDHRAKNMLAVVQSVLRLTQAASVEQYVSVVEGRVAALARAHTLLSKSQWTGVSLQKLVEDELGAFGSLDAGTVNIHGCRVQMVPESVQAMSMVMHELATNATKYGALSVPAGQLDVSWAWYPGGDLEIRWNESGGPAVAPPERRGLGSTLIEQCVRHQLGGEVEMNWRADGLRLKMRLPAAQLMPMEPDTAGLAEVARPGIAFSLAALRVLVVEDNAALALELAAIVSSLGAHPIGPVSTVAAALERVAREPLDAALLDVHLTDGKAWQVADALMARRIPYVFCSGYGKESGLHAAYAGAPTVGKPFRPTDVHLALTRALARSAAGTLPTTA